MCEEMTEISEKKEEILKKNEENVEKNRESFIFYRSFFEAIEELDDKKRLKMYDSISKLALKNEETEDLKGICKQLFTLIRPQISANNKRYEDGKKGGRPKQEITTGYSQKKPNKNVNVNEKVNVNVEGECKGETDDENISPPAPTISDDLNIEEFKADLKNWHGSLANVHLTEKQHADLLAITQSTQGLSLAIEQLSENIAAKNDKAQPYDEGFPDMHFIAVKRYWTYIRKNPDKFKHTTTNNGEKEIEQSYNGFA